MRPTHTRMPEPREIPPSLENALDAVQTEIEARAEADHQAEIASDSACDRALVKRRKTEGRRP